MIRRNKKEKKILSDKKILELGIQLTTGVEFIHSKHIVHRDLKPANLFLTHAGQLKIGDFGISRIITQEYIVSGHVYIYIYIYISAHRIMHPLSNWTSEDLITKVMSGLWELFYMNYAQEIDLSLG